MSTQSGIASLSPPISSLVAAAVKDGRELENLEGSEEQNVWFAKVAKAEVNTESLKGLDEHLISRTYLVGNVFTPADIAVYGALHPVIARLKSSEYYAVPSTTRYFDHIQHRPAVRAAADSLSSFALVTFDLENAPKAERKPDPPKAKKAPKAADAPGATVAATTAAAESSSTAEKKEGAAPKEKKEKQPKEKKEAAAGGESSKKPAAKAAAAADDSGEPVPSMIDLRVGRIVEIEKHPDADSLYVEKIDIGEETGPRTVVSGLVHYIPIEQMRDKYLVAVCNLKPVAMRGIKSHAMVLCATSKEGKEGGIELVQPPPGSRPGDRIYFEGENYENATPLAQLNPKKKIFETIQPGFTTLESHEAAWVNPATGSAHRIRTKDGVCKAPTFVGASLS